LVLALTRIDRASRVSRKAWSPPRADQLGPGEFGYEWGVQGVVHVRVRAEHGIEPFDAEAPQRAGHLPAVRAHLPEEDPAQRGRETNPSIMSDVVSSRMSIELVPRKLTRSPASAGTPDAESSDGPGRGCAW
jgi:hypothetical protein